MDESRMDESTIKLFLIDAVGIWMPLAAVGVKYFPKYDRAWMAVFFVSMAGFLLLAIVFLGQYIVAHWCP